MVKLNKIYTRTGDDGTTGLASGPRRMKDDLRVESYGTVDELNAFLGFARSICKDEEIAAWTQTIQKILFRLGSALATPPESKKQPPVIAPEDVLNSGEASVALRQVGSWLSTKLKKGNVHSGKAVGSAGQ